MRDSTSRRAPVGGLARAFALLAHEIGVVQRHRRVAREIAEQLEIVLGKQRAPALNDDDDAPDTIASRQSARRAPGSPPAPDCDERPGPVSATAPATARDAFTVAANQPGVRPNLEPDQSRIRGGLHDERAVGGVCVPQRDQEQRVAHAAGHRPAQVLGGARAALLRIVPRGRGQVAATVPRAATPRAAIAAC